MIINDGSYAPSTVTTSAPVAPSIDPTSAAQVKTQFAQSTDVTGVVIGLQKMIDAMVNVQPSQMRVNGRYTPPRGRQWKR